MSAPADVDVNGMELHDVSDDGQTLTTFWEVEEGHHQVTDMQGCLWGSLTFWENTLGPAPWIISCIKEGYKFPLRSIPDRFRRPNQQSAQITKICYTSYTGARGELLCGEGSGNLIYL